MSTAPIWIWCGPGFHCTVRRPRLETPVPVKLQPVMSLRTHILQLKALPAGASVSYSRTYISPGPMRVAVLPVGYCNGYSRLLSNRGWVLINGRRAPIRGRVCMNLTMVEVTDQARGERGGYRHLVRAGRE